METLLSDKQGRKRKQRDWTTRLDKEVIHVLGN